MTFNEEYFQQIFGVIMGTNEAAILANIYLARLESYCWKNVTKGNKKEFEYWVSQFNLLRDTITIDKFLYGDYVEFMDLFIFKGDDFITSRKFDISVFQKE